LSAGAGALRTRAASTVRRMPRFHRSLAILTLAPGRSHPR
jgi:hypothetical protein